jgi:hypothetical protein
MKVLKLLNDEPGIPDGIIAHLYYEKQKVCKAASSPSRSNNALPSLLANLPTALTPTIDEDVGSRPRFDFGRFLVATQYGLYIFVICYLHQLAPHVEANTLIIHLL